MVGCADDSTVTVGFAEGASASVEIGSDRRRDLAVQLPTIAREVGLLKHV
jgi:hypothetical protein